MSIPILIRDRGTPYHCATCRHFKTKCNGSELLCGGQPVDVSLDRYNGMLEYVFCANWNTFGDEQARSVFMELTEMTL